MNQRKLFIKHSPIIMGLASIVLLSGCTVNDVGHLLYNSALSSQKFQCEADNVGNSIETCKRNIDNAVNSAISSKASGTSDEHEAKGYEPKDYVNKQLQKRSDDTDN